MATISTTRKALRISNIEGSWATLHFVLTSGLVRIPDLLLLRRIREPDAEGTGLVLRQAFGGFRRRLILLRPMFPDHLKDGGTEFPKPE